MKTFSVIIPIYNMDKYLIRCIESVRNQTYKNLEIILIDDGSKDMSAEICDRYSEQDERIVVVHKKNGGIVSARQAGVEKATGEYIACVDSDDWLEFNYFEKISTVIRNYSPDVVCCGYYESDSQKDRIVHLNKKEGMYEKERLIKEIYPGLIFDEGGKCFSPNLWAKVFKRNIYVEQQLIDCYVTMGEDAACTYAVISKANSMYILSDCLYHYWSNPSPITRGKKTYPWDGPRLRYNHLITKIDKQYYNFDNQIAWHIVYAIFTVGASQFNKKESYRNIRREIILNVEKYKDVIMNCKKCSNFKSNMILYSLKYNSIILMYFFAESIYRMQCTCLGKDNDKKIVNVKYWS